MSKIRSVLIFSGILLDAGLQDHRPLDTEKNILPELAKRVSSALTSWFNYLQAVKNGYGEYTQYGGVHYKGEVAWGLPKGNGNKISSNGDRFQEIYKDINLQGQEILSFSDGKGMKILPNGDLYEGELKDGTLHGQGILYFSDGKRLEGTWKDGKPHGQGVFYWPNGVSCRETWK